MAKWRDRRNYQTGDGEVEASEINFGRFKLSVHHHIYHAPDVWLASSTLFSAFELESKNIDEAKLQAKEKLQGILCDALKEMDEA